MANYTVELNTLMQNGFVPRLDLYPIFDENHRNVLNQKIIDHYRYREIGVKQPERFNFFLSRTMNEIMPRYNQLYKSALIPIDPLITFYIQEINKGRDASVENKDSRVDTKGNATDTGNTTSDKTTDLTGNQTVDGTGKEVKDGTLNQTVDGTATEAQKGTGTETVDTTTADKGKRDTISHATIGSDTVDKGKKTETSTNTKTNDLTTNTTIHNDGSGTNNTTGSKDTFFSDVPQNNINMNTTYYPANQGGGVQSETVSGHFTTRTKENTSENARTTTTEDGTTNTRNTGTVKDVADGTVLTENTQNVSGNNDSTENVLEDNSGTKNVKGNTTDTKDTNKTSRDITDQTTHGTTDKTMQEKLTKGEQKVEAGKGTSNLDRVYTDEELGNILTKREASKLATREISGRKNVSPADLIKKYRDTIINIDMMIIEDLSTCFMGVYYGSNDILQLS